MEQNFHVRKAEQKDAVFISGLSSMDKEQLGIESLQQRIAQIGNNPDHCIYLIEKDSVVIAWIHAFLTYRIEAEPFVEIGGLHVQEACRHAGYATVLVDRVKQWARLNNLGTVRVRSRQERKEAHRFYESLGFAYLKMQKVFIYTVDSEQ